MSRQYISTFRQLNQYSHQESKKRSTSLRRPKTPLFLKNFKQPAKRNLPDLIKNELTELENENKNVVQIAVKKNGVQLKMLENALATLRIKERRALRELENEMRKYRNQINTYTKRKQKTEIAYNRQNYLSTLEDEDVVLKRVGKMHSIKETFSNSIDQSFVDETNVEKLDPINETNVEKLDPIDETKKEVEKYIFKLKDKVADQVDQSPSAADMDNTEVTDQAESSKSENDVSKEDRRSSLSKHNASSENKLSKSCHDYMDLAKMFGQGQVADISNRVEKLAVSKEKESEKKNRVTLSNSGKKSTATKDEKTLRLKDSSTQFEDGYVQEDTHSVEEPRELWPSWFSPNSKGIQADLDLRNNAENASKENKSVDVASINKESDNKKFPNINNKLAISNTDPHDNTKDTKKGKQQGVGKYCFNNSSAQSSQIGFNSKCVDNSSTSLRKNANYAFLTSYEDPIQEVDEDVVGLHDHHKSSYSNWTRNEAAANNMNFSSSSHNSAEKHIISYRLDNNPGSCSSMPQQSEFKGNKRISISQHQNDETRQRSTPVCSSCKTDPHKKHEKQTRMFSQRGKRQRQQQNSYIQFHRNTADFTNDDINFEQLPLHSKFTTYSSQRATSPFQSCNKRNYRLVNNISSPARAANANEMVTEIECNRLPSLPAYWSPVYCIEYGRPKSALLMPLQHPSNQNVVVRLEIEDAVGNSNVTANDQDNAMHPNEISLVTLPHTFRLKRESSNGRALSHESRGFGSSKSRPKSGMQGAIPIHYRSNKVSENISNQDACDSQAFIRQNRNNRQTKQNSNYNPFGFENKLSINKTTTFEKSIDAEKRSPVFSFLSHKQSSTSTATPTSEKTSTKRIIIEPDQPTYSQKHSFQFQSRKFQRSARRRIKKNEVPDILWPTAESCKNNDDIPSTSQSENSKTGLLPSWPPRRLNTNSTNQEGSRSPEKRVRYRLSLNSKKPDKNPEDSSKESLSDTAKMLKPTHLDACEAEKKGRKYYHLSKKARENLSKTGSFFCSPKKFFQT